MPIPMTPAPRRSLRRLLWTFAATVACVSLATALLDACGASSPGTTTHDAGPSDGTLDARADRDALPPSDATDATKHDASLPDASDAGSGTCPGVGDPVACDDGTASDACPDSKMLGAKTSYHLHVTGSSFAPSGACVYVTPSTCSTTNGAVLEFSGSTGTSPGALLNGIAESSPYCFELISVGWDDNWADDGLTTGGPAGIGGNVLAASKKPQAVIAWAHAHLRASATTPLCATGGSAGSSLLLFQVMHDTGQELLDHVQITSATPYARFDEGCDPDAGPEGTNVVCSTLPSTTDPQYAYLSGSSNPGAVKLVQGDTHDPECDVSGHAQTASERSALQAMSLVTNGFAPMQMKKTSLSVYMCGTVPNATQGQAVYVFGTNADLAAKDSGPYTGLISLNLSTSFYGCKAGTTCMPHFVCDPGCATEDYGQTLADRMVLATDMRDGCVLRH